MASRSCSNRQSTELLTYLYGPRTTKGVCRCQCFKKGNARFMATLIPNQKFSQLASEDQLTQTVQALDHVKEQYERRRVIASPDVLVGSVQAITQAGQILLASASGSQLSLAAAGAGKIIWVVGTQKLVRSMEEGQRRIQEYCYPLEDVRTRKVYGQPSMINKLLIVQGEHVPGRISVVLVKQPLGF